MKTLENNIKVLAINGLDRGLAGLAAANLTKTITIIDIDGKPLVNAHLVWGKEGVVTDQNGDAIITVPDHSTQVTISYVGKRTHVARFGDLGSLITLQNQTNNLPPVVIKPTNPNSPTSNKFLVTAAIGVAAIFLVSWMASQKGLAAPATKGKKTKAKTKKKKSKGLKGPETITM